MTPMSFSQKLRTTQSVDPAVAQRRSDSRAPEVSRAPASQYSLGDVPALGSTDVAQLVKKTEHGIPKNVQQFLGDGYHNFKQKNWHRIAEAHQQVYGKPPKTVGAPYVIDGKVGAQLIANLTRDGWQPRQGAAKAAKGRARQAASRDESSSDSDSDASDSDASDSDASDSDASDSSEHEDSGGDDAHVEPEAAGVEPEAEPEAAGVEVEPEAAGAEPEAQPHAAAAAEPEAPTPAAATPAVAKAHRAYSSHEDARAKLGKNPSLGPHYLIKGGDGTVFDATKPLPEMPAPEKGKGKGKRR